MSADEAWAQLNAARDARVSALEADMHAVQSGNGKLAETAASHQARLDANDGDHIEMRDDIKWLRALVFGFAFTVAGAGVTLALTVGSSHP